jgi:uncharacterized protein (TIGR01777 family)
MTILITGATGLIGKALTKTYLADKTPVRILTRAPERAGTMFGSNVTAFAWTPAKDPVPQAALERVQTVFHLMGEPVSGRWTPEKKAQIIASRVTAAEKIAAALEGRPVRLISASSFGIYPGRHGAIYEETAPLAPPTTEIQSILQNWERAALSASRPPVTHANVVRFGMVCAKDGYPKKLVRLFRRGIGFVAGSGEQIVPIVDIDDAVGILRWVASGQAGDGPVNCVSPHTPSFAEVAGIIARCLGKPVRFKVPEWLARSILGGSADYFLLSYNVRPKLALERGYNFRVTDPERILTRAILGNTAAFAG